MTILEQAERLIQNEKRCAKLHASLPNPPHEGEGISPLCNEQ
jgi:hypothetical protein